MTSDVEHPPDPQTGQEAVRRLVAGALALYEDDGAAAAELAEQRRRLDEPLRIALVGRVKAGKSTLLNALVGARIAPTDAGECTRVVTMYRHGRTPRVTLHDTAGRQRPLPVRRVEGGLRLDLAGTPVEEATHLVVDWPASGLAPATLIDTPGLSSLSADTSARTRSFLEPEDSRLPGADAVVFLTRQMQPEDIAHLAAFQAGTGAQDVHTTTITVLSRADEVGAARLDALHAAEGVARRMAADPAVRAVSSTVLPVAGLLALAGRTVRHGDFVALKSLAGTGPGELETMLLTADRFARPDAPVGVTRPVRVALLERLGLFGVRMSIALIRAGIDEAQTLAEELVRRSGLAELERLIAVQFTHRGAQLKTATALRTVERVLRERPVPGTDQLWRDLERLRLSSDDVVELALLARSRAADGPLPAGLRAEGERLLGATGLDPAARLGLPADAGRDDLRSAALAALERWRTAGSDPLARRATVDAIDVVTRACEALLADLDEPRSVAESPQPRPRRADEQEGEGEHEEAGLDREGDPVDVVPARHRALRDVDGEDRDESGAQERPPGPRPTAQDQRRP